MVIRMRDPFETLLSLQRAMDNAMGRDWFGTLTSGRGAFPPVNVFRRGDDYVLVAELPGVKKEDLDVQVKGDTVRIQGKKSIDYADNVSQHRRERTAGQFGRTLTLPARIDVEKITAEYRDGVLTLTLPPVTAEKPHSVAIS